jgi:acetyl esterase/lipase
MEIAFLVIGVLALVVTANAIRPVGRNMLRMPSFFASWLAIELAGWCLLLELVVAGVLVAVGALHGWAGWTGLATIALSCAGLCWVIARAGRTSAALAAAGVSPRGSARFPRAHVLFPFLMKRRPGVRVDRDIVYGEVDGIELRLDVYRPAEGGDRRPGILQVHGGDWAYSDKGMEAIPLLGHLAASGWVCLAANYRLSPAFAFPAHLHDLKRAVAWYRQHAPEYGADPDFLCVTGGSAGAHLASLVALTSGQPGYQPGFEEADTSIAAAVCFYGVYDFTNRLGTWSAGRMRRLERVVVQRTLADDPAAFAAASPMDWVHSDAPPFFILHGDIDTLSSVAEAREFVTRLCAASSHEVIYAELPGAQHNFDLFPSHRCARAIESAERFLSAIHGEYLLPGRTAESVTEPSWTSPPGSTRLDQGAARDSTSPSV